MPSPRLGRGRSVLASRGPAKGGRCATRRGARPERPKSPAPALERPACDAGYGARLGAQGRGAGRAFSGAFAWVVGDAAERRDGGRRARRRRVPPSHQPQMVMAAHRGDHDRGHRSL
jgi:hypothetical protein